MPTLALSMIVRDAAATLGACLDSVRDIADEIVIADTGSVDSTAAIARERGARIVETPWENDFAAARNRALAEVHADWVLVLDADEILDQGAAAAIPTLLADSAVGGYQVSIRNYVLSLEHRIWDRPAKPNDSLLPAAKAYPAYVDHENVRLFRRDSRVFFVGRVHESVGPRIEELGLPLGRATFLIHHFGLAADDGTRERKNRFYRELGKLKVNEMPRNPQAHLELGLVELDNFGNLDEALACFRRSCELNPRLGVAWFFAGVANLRLGRHREALRCLRQAQERGHATPLVAEAIGDAHYNLADFSKSVRAYQKALKLSPDSPLLESKLGLATVRAGLVEEGLGMIRHATQQRPDLAELHDRLILSLVWLERIPEAAVAAEDKLRCVRAPVSSDFMRAASLWARQGNWARATAVLHVGLQLYPSDLPIMQALQELAAQEGPRVEELVAALSGETKGLREIKV